jgi:serine/threonine protein phosphatase PrpC
MACDGIWDVLDDQTHTHTKTTHQKNTQEDCFIVMACDGIWDVLDDQAVCDIAGEHFSQPKDAAASVVRTGFVCV